ncbi:MAG: hypothetical protein ACXVZN_11785 [Gaiellaceae bacterium]
MLTRCDGTRPLGELLDEVAAGAGLDRDSFVASSLAVVWRLVELGFLVPAKTAGGPHGAALRSERSEND